MRSKDDKRMYLVSVQVIKMYEIAVHAADQHAACDMVYDMQSLAIERDGELIEAQTDYVEII